ncbi:2-hydroxyacid dehydrogenase [Nitratireductor aquibiodomus]|nr:glyoxylate/hydroxypyruvate reductase A [Nitratireductor aquibiodomus]
MDIAIVSRLGKLEFMAQALSEALPEARFFHWPEPEALSADIALCWAPEPGVLARMPNLRLIHSIGAGVDSILADPHLPPVPICRIRDEGLARAMADYVLWSVLYFHRQFDRVIANAGQHIWHRYEQRAREKMRVGIMGLGSIGSEVARVLSQHGYPVSGWARSRKDMAGVDVYAGDAELPNFLESANVLVCLLPLTAETEGILNHRHLSMLPEDASLILCSRGEHLVVEDLLELVKSGHMRGAILDVFTSEPLPACSPLWSTPGILVTPHMSGLAKPRDIASQIAENIARLERGETPHSVIDPSVGY